MTGQPRGSGYPTGGGAGTVPRIGAPPRSELVWGEPVTADQLAAAERGYAGCGTDERLLWERLSVFEGAFDRDAVRAVCASGTLPPARVGAALDRLAPLALLPVDDLFEGERATARYWMPHPLRAVGARRLTERGDRPAVVLRHRRWCARLARRAADHWQDGRHLDARDLALRELPDLAVAMDPTTAPPSPCAGADPAVGIVVSLWFLWVVCGRVEEGRARLRHALALHPGPPPARALWLAAYLELEAGRPADADPLLVRARAAAERDGDGHCLGLLAHLRGAADLFRGRTRAAADGFREALALTGEDPDLGPTRELCWSALALSLGRTDPEAARKALDRLPSGRRAGKGEALWADAWAHQARAGLLARDGEGERAVGHARWALRGHLALGSASGASGAAELLAELRLMTGEPASAARLLGAVDVLRTSVFGDAYRPAASCAASRDRSRRALGKALDGAELRRAYEEGGHLGLFALAEAP
ncbi:tetratricopeptide repeat protein [Streptomyces sp. NPDC001744]|uniref:tetratricopeptide repeat protein n=1 Tax=Streptomyces sp. NPDC001744 TaxID=3364606 RepID=UPI0036AAB1D8